MAAAIPATRACGGRWIETVLNHPNAALLSPPAGFMEEIRRIDVPPSPFVARPRQSPDPGDDRFGADTLDLELADLSAVLGETHPALGDYRELREVMLGRYAKREKQFTGYGEPAPESARAQTLLEAARRGEFPPGLPPDVVAYLVGAVRYVDGDTPGAATVWRKLMRWREADRPNRSVWAAWMLAKITRATDRTESDRWYQETIRLARAGFRDPLRLERYAGGWLGRSALDRGDRGTALTIYANQALSGDRLGVSSLQRAMPDLATCTDDELDRYVSDPFLRNLLTAALLRSASSDFFGDEDQWKTSPEEFLRPARRWLAAIERAGIREAEEAERFAWMAYQLGDFASCAKWLAHAAPDARVANSLRGKLALQRGDLAGAERFFRDARPSSDPPDATESESWVVDSDARAVRDQHALADHAVVQIARKRYPDALVDLLRGGYRADSAYVAERLLSLPELVRTADEVRAKNSAEVPRLGGLTARRLARTGHLAIAEEYFPAAWRPIFRVYAQRLEEGRKPQNSRDARAASLWSAAQIHYVLGDQLFETFDFPDGWEWWSPDNDRRDLAWIRAQWNFGLPDGAHPPIQADEIFRSARHTPKITRRDSDAFAAANLAWEAAALMPDHSADTANVLGIAGTWIKYLDPKAADRFYKAMIWRNWSTPLAREADRKRWFPAIDWTYDPFATAGLERPPDFYY